MVIFSIALGFKTIPNVNRKFPKISFSKIHNINYNRPLYISQKPYTINLIKSAFNFIDNILYEPFAMASFPLSYSFPILFNLSEFDYTN
tara:strand:+ start:1980 stop:2246 length:267 start_codon:yes stop_codon:yes gene_type:complete